MKLIADVFVQFFLDVPQRIRLWLKRAFSPRVEDSVQLRAVGVASLWLAAAGLVWAGGSLWMALGGAALGTLGYGISWYRRRHKSRVWPLFIASLIIALALVMRSQVLEALTGN